jgi:SAM-dependent methyltransferase
MSSDSPYSRLNYRRLIAWPQRIEREWPFLQRELERSPAPSVVDLGSGTGEHARHLASLGYRAVGIDQSDEHIEKAREYENEFPPHGPEFLLGDIADLTRLTSERFGMAICLGNVLPHLEDEDLLAMAREVHAGLVTGGRLLIQLLNYERILACDLRHLPLNFRDDPDETGEIVFLRLMTPDGPSHVLFNPMTLALKPGEDPPVGLKSAKEVRLRAWMRPELEDLLNRSEFEIEALYGDMVGGDYEPRDSSDLVLVAVRS